MNTLRKASLNHFRVVSVSVCVKPTLPCQLDLGMVSAAGQRGRRFPKVLQGNLGELRSAKANAVVGRGRSSGEAGQRPWSEGPLREKRDDANQMARRIMSKDCNRGQSAMWRRVGNRSSIWRSIHWNQCETEPRGEGERNR